MYCTSVIFFSKINQNGCRNPFHKSLKRMSTSVSCFYFVSLSVSDVEIRFETSKMDFDIRFILLLFYISFFLEDFFMTLMLIICTIIITLIISE